MSEAWTSEPATVEGTYRLRGPGGPWTAGLTVGVRPGPNGERSLYPIPSAETVAAAVEALQRARNYVDCEGPGDDDMLREIDAVQAALRGSPASGALEKGRETE